MSAAWWGREALDKRLPGSATPPLMLKSGRVYIRNDVSARIPDFKPEWTRAQEGDPGFALLKLHAELAEPLVERLNRLPEKSLIEYLRIAAVGPTPPSPAKAMLAFFASQAAPQSVLIPRGFQVSSAAADGSGDTVIFETEQSLFATPGEIKQSFVQEGSSFFEIDLAGSDDASGEPAFGQNPRPGSAILIGINTPVEPRPAITLGFQLATGSGAPTPVANGGIEPVVSAARPFLRWEFFDGGRFEPAEVIRDETRSFAQSGIVELAAPEQWRPGIPEGVAATTALRWIRLKIIFGEFVSPPEIAFARLNLVSAIAARTVRNEVLEYIPDSDGRRMRLSQTPVLADSLRLTVNEGEINASVDISAGSTPSDGAVEWQEVDDLNGYGADDRVYELDAVNGELQFGDGIHGAILPTGFRHVVAEQYQVATGLAGAVGADEITGLVSSAPFLVGVTNPVAASGGRDEEELEQTLLRGPQEIRARARAVTTADYDLMAHSASGANIYRAHAVAGVHAGLDDAQVPGTVSVYLVGPPQTGVPPHPDPGSLQAVGTFLTEEVAPAGVEVVTASPMFHRVSVRASLVIAADTDSGSVIRRTLEELDEFLDPVRGGESGQGWPFGGIVYHNAVVRRLMDRVENLQAVSALNLLVDGETLPACADFTPQQNALLWPAVHELRIVDGGLS